MATDLSRYKAEVDPDNPNNSQTQLLNLTGTDRSVLDVGCASGDLVLALLARGCRVSGVDIEDVLLPEARAGLEAFEIADIERTPLSKLFAGRTFDTILFGDVLEHLVEPLAALQDAAQLLAPDGAVIASIPNVAHGAVRLSLLQGKWDYTATGLLDSTHLRFFTQDTACQLFEDAGMAIEVLQSTVLDPLEGEIPIDTGAIPDLVVEWVRHQPRALDFQYIVKGRLLQPGEVAPPRPPLEPLEPYVRSRRIDSSTAALGAAQAVTQAEMVRRDHVIGLEAATTAAAKRVETAEARTERVRARAKRLRRDLDDLIEEIGALRPGRGRRRLQAKADRLRASGRNERE